MLNKIFSFFTGMVCGAMVGAVTGLFIAPSSGAQLLESINNRIELAKSEALKAQQETEQELLRRFEEAKQGKKTPPALPR